MTRTDLSTSAPLILRRVVEELPRYAYRISDESHFQKGIEEVLSGAGLEFCREYVAGPRDRFDFLVLPGIVIEAKVKGSLPAALRQIGRYAEREDVSAIVLATTRFWGGGTLSPYLHGKPVHMVQLRGGAF